MEKDTKHHNISVIKIHLSKLENELNLPDDDYDKLHKIIQRAKKIEKELKHFFVQPIG